MTAIDSNWTWKNLRRLATGAMPPSLAVSRLLAAQEREANVSP